MTKEGLINGASSLLQMIQLLMPEDVSVTFMYVNDEGETIIHDILQANTFKLDMKPANVGKSEPGNPFYEMFKSVFVKKEKFEMFMPKEVYGIPMKSVFVPLSYGGEVLCCISINFSMAEKIELVSSTNELEEDLKHTNETIGNIEKGSRNLSSALQEITAVSETVSDKVEEATQLISAIQGNASKSNILALNATIEAARAGEAGRGFAVVASEMGKLAKMSSDSSKKIQESLSGMFGALDNISKAVLRANDVATEQLESVENFSKDINSIAENSEVLSAMVKSSDIDALNESVAHMKELRDVSSNMISN